MKLFLSFVAVISVSLGSMQVAVAHISEKTGSHQSKVSVSKELSHVEINPFVDQQRLAKAEVEKSQIDSKMAKKKRFVREGRVMKYKSVV